MVGRTVTLDEVSKKVTSRSISVSVPDSAAVEYSGENLIRILSANEYLTRANLMKAYLYPEVDTPIPRAKNVVVPGSR